MINQCLEGEWKSTSVQDLCPAPLSTTQVNTLDKNYMKIFHFFPALLVFCIYLKCTAWWFDTHTYCKIIIKLINTSIASHSYLLLNRKNAEDLVSQQISYVQHSIINCRLHAVIRSSELVRLTSERLYPCTLFSLCLSHLQQLF